MKGTDVSVKSRSKGFLGFLVAFFLVTAFVAAYKIIGFYYAINDDTTMQTLASGSVTGQPEVVS